MHQTNSYRNSFLYFAIYTLVYASKFTRVFAASPAGSEVGYKMMNLFAKQLFVGLYIHQIVLIGLFCRSYLHRMAPCATSFMHSAFYLVLRGASGAAVGILEVIILISTVLVHISFQRIFPFLHRMPLPSGAPKSKSLVAMGTVATDEEPKPLSEELQVSADTERNVEKLLGQPGVNATVWMPEGAPRSKEVQAELIKFGLEARTDGAYVDGAGKVHVGDNAASGKAAIE
jgi:hypothetical protein